MQKLCLGIVAALLTGCGAELLTTTAIQGELQSQQLSAMQRQIKNTAATSGRIQLERAIQTYTAEKSAYPPSLDALAPNWIASVPRQPDGTPYTYDPATGRIGTKPFAGNGPTPADHALMQKINAAIYQYGMQTGYYPPTLDALAPTYLPTAPRTHSGEAFLYDNTTGAVTYPGRSADPAPASSANPASSTVSGMGPMGEAVTGIGMQQQLNRNSNAGTNAAGSYARESLDDITSSTNDRTNQVMDDLGL